MSKGKLQHKRFGHQKHEHKNFYGKFSKADERAKQMDAVSGRLRRQAEERERQVSRPSYGYGAGGYYYSSLSDYTLREIEPVLHLPHERYQARRILDFI